MTGMPAVAAPVDRRRRQLRAATPSRRRARAARQPRPAPRDVARARRRRERPASRRLRRAVLVALLAAGLLASGAYLALQSVYFIGTNNRGLITLFNGMPYRLPGNVDLYSSRLRLRRQRGDADADAPAEAARSLAALGR